MRPTDLEAFAKIINGLAIMKRSPPLTDEALDLWWNAMQAWSIEDFRAAANHLSRSCQFMPSPFEFEQLRQAGRLSADEAWAEVKKAIATYAERLPSGKRTTWDPFTDKVIAAVHAGGLETLGRVDDDVLPHIQRRFLTAYAEMRDVADVREAVPQITNVTEAQAIENRKRLGNELRGLLK